MGRAEKILTKFMSQNADAKLVQDKLDEITAVLPKLTAPKRKKKSASRKARKSNS